MEGFVLLHSDLKWVHFKIIILSKMALDTARESTSSEKQTEINWQDFNYPPLIKLIHFSPSELPP
jgi:hypothetical protein